MLDLWDSATYQAILRKGRMPGGQQFLIRQGTKKFGKPDAATLTAIEAIRDFDKFAAMCERILDLDVRDWIELLRTT
jgi:hypothetical protein